MRPLNGAQLRWVCLRQPLAVPALLLMDENNIQKKTAAPLHWRA